LSACEDIEGRLQQVGYAHLPDTDTLSLFGFSKGNARDSFAASWNNLGTDLYMDDGGRYRRRRHATFQVINGVAERQPGFRPIEPNCKIFLYIVVLMACFNDFSHGTQDISLAAPIQIGIAASRGGDYSFALSIAAGVVAVAIVVVVGLGKERRGIAFGHKSEIV